MRPLKLAICLALSALCVGSAVNAETLADEVQTALHARDFAGAEALVEKHLAAQPDDAEGFRQLSIIYLAQGRWDDSIEQGRRAVKLSPDDPDMHMAVAAGYREKARRGKFLGAVRNAGKWREGVEKAMELDPGHLGARRWMILYLANAPGIGGGDKDRALEIARETVQYQAYRGHLLTGYVHRKRHEVDDAVAEFEAAMAAAPDSGEVYYELGYCYMVAERFGEAEASFRRYIEFEPYDAGGYEALGDCFRDQGRDEDALPEYTRGVEANAYAWSVRWELAQVLERLGRKDEAIEHLKALVELTPHAMNVGKAKKRLRRLTNRR